MIRRQIGLTPLRKQYFHNYSYILVIVLSLTISDIAPAQIILSKNNFACESLVILTLLLMDGFYYAYLRENRTANKSNTISNEVPPAHADFKLCFHTGHVHAEVTKLANTV